MINFLIGFTCGVITIMASVTLSFRITASVIEEHCENEHKKPESEGGKWKS